MTLLESSAKLKANFSFDYSTDYSKYSWLKYMQSLEDFYTSLMQENDKSILEKCVLDNPNWELPIEPTALLLMRAKKLGCNSDEFLRYYYGYIGAHLDPEESKNSGIEAMCHKLGLVAKPQL